MTTSRVSTDPLALLPGTVLAEFCVRRVLGSGGFGIVYLARDDSLHRQVAIKEYLPASLAGRQADGRVVARSDDAAQAFRLGLKSFVNEARLLARFDHPSLVKVHRFWEDRGTAYMSMPYYEGATLRQVRKSLGGPPDEAWLQRLLDGLLGALEALHRADIVHRDVAPDNILVLPGGAPLLLDFGAARHVLAEQPQVLTAMLKPTYAPIEQYAGAADLRQGPWTDLYATAATLHYCLTGEAPPAAAARTLDDRYRPLHQRTDLRQSDGKPYDARWLAALDWALEVLPHRRPQSVAQWRAVLDGRQRLPRGVQQPVAATDRAERADLPDDFPATEVHARQWTPSRDGPVTVEQGSLTPAVQPLASAAVTPGPAAETSAATPAAVPRSSSAARERTAPAASAATAAPPRPASRGRSRRPTPPAAAWQRPWMAAGMLGLVGALGLVGLLQWGAQAARPAVPVSAAAPLPPAISARMAAVSDRYPGADDADADAVPAGSGAAFVLKEFAAVSLHGPEEIHETAAEQGRVIRVPPRSFESTEASERGAAERSTGEAKQAASRQRVVRTQSAAAPLTPRQHCESGDRGWFSRMVCMHRSCELPKWREHPQCENWRPPTDAERRRLNDPF